MDQATAHMVAASKVLMLKPGVMTEMPITSAEEKAQRRIESDQAEEGPNYALMAFSCLSSDSKLLKDLKKFELMVLGYEDYNAVPPPYTGNFVTPTPDLSFTGLDELVNKLVFENYKAKPSKEEPKTVKKNDDGPIIEEWVSNNEEEDVSQPKIEKKIVRPSIAKIEFVKPRQQEKTARKSVKQVEQHRQNTHSPRGNQRNWNNMMSQKLGSNFEMFNKACYMPKAVVNAVMGNTSNAVKASACWVWKPKHKVLDNVSKHNSASITLKSLIMLMHKADPNYEEIDRGYVAFGRNPKGEKIIGKGLMKKMYCLVVIDDYSRFTWVFFVATKDETSGILKSFITRIENLVDHKGIMRQFSVARTPQQNEVAERRNRILIEAAKTVLADSKLSTTFWTEAVNTACYVQN
nr:putative ribonuclease H-like domain-containing protein [Tanacetum cinerariifolium]